MQTSRQLVKSAAALLSLCSIRTLIGVYTEFRIGPPCLGLDSLYHLLSTQIRPGGDITCIPTGEGWLYPAIIKGLCTYKRVDYAFSSAIDTVMTLEALDMAVRRCSPPKGLIFHSERGVQCAAFAFRERLEFYGIRQSMSRKGDPYDNAVAEHFFSRLKRELIHLKHYPTRASRTDRRIGLSGGLL